MITNRQKDVRDLKKIIPNFLGELLHLMNLPPVSASCLPFQAWKVKWSWVGLGVELILILLQEISLFFSNALSMWYKWPWLPTASLSGRDIITIRTFAFAHLPSGLLMEFAKRIRVPSKRPHLHSQDLMGSKIVYGHLEPFETQWCLLLDLNHFIAPALVCTWVPWGKELFLVQPAPRDRLKHTSIPGATSKIPKPSGHIRNKMSLTFFLSFYFLILALFLVMSKCFILGFIAVTKNFTAVYSVRQVHWAPVGLNDNHNNAKYTGSGLGDPRSVTDWEWALWWDLFPSSKAWGDVTDVILIVQMKKLRLEEI